MNPQSNQQNSNTSPKERVVNSLTSLASFPCNIKVYGQNPDEKILLFIREHKITLLSSAIGYLLLLLIPFFLEWTLKLLNSYSLNGLINMDKFFNTKYWYAILLVWLAYILRETFNAFFSWFYNINILTSNRFVDIDFINIFKIRVEETSIEDIEDVKDTQSGITQSIFDMGDVEVFTASGATVFNLNNVPKSHKIRDFIMDVVISKRKNNNRE